MIKSVLYNGKCIRYDLQHKKVKNINIRIKPDGQVFVSANVYVSQDTIDKFIISKGDFILRAIDKFKSQDITPRIQYYDDESIREEILNKCESVYPYFEKRGVPFPQIRFRKMKSQWGNCHTKKKILTFSTNLMYTPTECIEYVVAHEFTHFLQPNHSSKFYNELEKVMPDWKNRRIMLKNIHI